MAGKRILLLGERHSNTGICPETFCQEKGENCHVYEVHKWLGDLAKNAPQCLDIFLETDYLLPYSKKSVMAYKDNALKKFDNGINAIESQFRQCLTVEAKQKEQCYSDQLRFHYINVRDYIYNWGKNEYPITQLYQLKPYFFGQMLKKVDLMYMKEEDNFQKHREIIYSYILGIDRSENAEREFYNYLADLRGQSGMWTPNKDGKVIFYDNSDAKKYFKKFFENIDKEASKLNPNINKKKFFDILLDIFVTESITRPIMILDVPMDVYFLLRLFIVFDEKKLYRGPVGCRDSEYVEIKNAIVYGGSAHTDIYSLFLQKYFEVEPQIFVEQDAENKCINFESPFDFFE